MKRLPLRPYGRYLALIALGNLVWEAAQMPLYTIWIDGTPAQIGFAWAHCTVGDVLIGAITLAAAVILWRARFWPREAFWQVATTTIALALAYTIFSEWLNIEVRRSWAYRDIMPTLPGLGTGLSPILQWVIVPLLAFWYARSGQPDR